MLWSSLAHTEGTGPLRGWPCTSCTYALRPSREIGMKGKELLMWAEASGCYWGTILVALLRRWFQGVYPFLKLSLMSLEDRDCHILIS